MMADCQIKKTLGHCILQSVYVPFLLTILGVILMLPSLKVGLIMDDWIQRIPQLSHDNVPPNLIKTGMVPDNSGTLRAVLFETFGFVRERQKVQQAKDYGVLPWWLPDDLKCSLWRPFTAFTHWIDYQLFPDKPILMHAHNIAVFAAIIFVVSLLYRRLIGPGWVAALAALMYVLDPNMYFPVMFVANRGFLIALLFGLLCLYAHHRWRSEQSIIAAAMSVVFFTLSILSNEAGVSTFAFILAYAIAQDNACWKRRLVTILPAVVVIIIWRIVYQSMGYGVSGLGAAYLDPGRDPLRFLFYLPGYFAAIISGQISGLAPDILLPINAKWFKIIGISYIVFAPVGLLLFLPIIRKNRTACFWMLVMVFAAIPVAACPSGKNFGFVAVGAFGLIAVFASDLIQRWRTRPLSSCSRIAFGFCLILLFMHIPCAAAAKIIAAKSDPRFIEFFANPKSLDNLNINNQSKLFIFNAPSQLPIAEMPFSAAYYNKPIPAAIHALGFFGTDLHVSRLDERTLVIESASDSIFDTDHRSVLHFSHAFGTLNKLFYSKEMFAPGRTFKLSDMTVTIEELGPGMLPKKVAFNFEANLDNPSFIWLRFNPYNFSYEPVELPEVGQSIQIDGPHVVRISEAMKYILQ